MNFAFPLGAKLIAAGLLMGTVALHLNADSARKAEIVNLKAALAVSHERIELDASALEQRDALIARQNTGIKALTETASANRRVYEAAYSRADERAKDHDKRAEELIRLKVGAGAEELDECRQARRLLIEELIR
jgi:hypothetical protein